MPRTKSCLLLIVVNLLLFKLHMMWLERMQKKVIQFATMLHLLQQGHPMLEYEALTPLFKFLRVEKQQETLE